MARQHFNHLKYQVFKSQARESALTAFKDQLAEQGKQEVDVSRVRLDAITQAALEASYLWGDQAALFPWEDVPEWKARDVKGFDLSMWYEQELCGLCYATPRDSKITIKIILLEGKPDKTHPLQGYVAALALSAIDAYSRMIGCTIIEIQDPAPGVIPWYEALGFQYDNNQRLVISVEPA